MSWQDEMLEVVRVLVLDADGTKYEEDTLLRVIAVAAFQVATEINLFSSTYSVAVSNQTISPDPTSPATKDDSFTNLTCLKAACIINQGAAMNAADQAVYVKDGSSAIDLRGALQGKLSLLKLGWCATYAKEKTDFQTSKTGSVAGAAVMTPFRTVATGWGRGMYVVAPGRDRESYGNY